MKVACPHCSATYNVDDRRVPAGGLNVRCPKCRQTFPVRPDAPPPATADAPVRLPAPAPPPLPPDLGPAAASGAGSVPLPPPLPRAPQAAGAIPLPPPDAFAPRAEGGAAGAIPLPPPDPFGRPASPAPSAAGAIPLPPPDPFAPSAAGAVPLPPPDPFAPPAAAKPPLPELFEPTPHGAQAHAAPLPSPAADVPADPFAGAPFAPPEPPGTGPSPFATAPGPFAAELDPLPVPTEPARPAAFAARPPPAPFETEPFAATSAPAAEEANASEPALGFGEVSLSPPASPAAATAPAAPPSTGEELEMLFGDGAAPKAPAVGGFKVRRRSGKVFGPFDERQIVDMLAKGELMGNEDVARDDGAWTSIAAVPAFGEALRRVTAEPEGVAAPAAGEAAHDPQRAVPFGNRMAPARVSSGAAEPEPRRWVKPAAMAGVAALVLGAAVLGAVRYGRLLPRVFHRGDAARAVALSAQARAAAARGDFPSERGALDLAAQALAADPQAPDVAALHAAIFAGLELRHGAPPEALVQARASADRLDRDEKGEIGTLVARLAVTLATNPGPATQPQELAVEQASQKRAPDAEVLLLLGRAALARGDGARADALFGRLASVEPGVRAAHGAGRAALARRDPAAAKAAFARALAKDPNHLPSKLELAALAEADGDVAGAEAQLAPLLAPGAEKKVAPADRARALVVRGKLLARSLSGVAAADAAFAAAVDADPRLVEARVALASHRMRRGDPAAAVAATDPVADQAPRTPALAAVRIRALALAGRALDASSLATAALAGAPGDPGLLLARATALELSGKPDDAATLYRDAAGRDPSAYEPRLALGRIALARKDLALAASEIAAAVEKGPREPAAQSALGELRAAQGDAAGAEAAYRAALALDPEHGPAELGLAKLALARGDVAGARARLERALVEEPRSLEARLAYGGLLWRAKDLPGAEKAFQAAVDLAPRHPVALCRLGAVRLERGDAAAAVRLLGTAANEDPRSAEAHLWLGRALLATKEVPSAIGELKRAVELDPASAEHHLALGEALERSGALTEAIEAYRAAAAADARSPEGHERIGNLYAANNRCDEALPEYEKAIALAPRAARLKIALGDCRAKLGKYDEAARTYREVLKADPAAVQVLYRLARAVHESESSKAALPWYERAAREDAQNAMPHYYLGYMYKERNQRTRAVQEFRKFLSLKPDADEKKDIEAEIEDLGGNR